MNRLVLLLLMLSPLSARAVWLNPNLRVAIKDACLARVHSSHAMRFCGCVGTKHFRSAKQMPDVQQADRDLHWVLAYYRTRDAAGLARLRANPDNLVAYDAFIGTQCRGGTRTVLR